MPKNTTALLVFSFLMKFAFAGNYLAPKTDLAPLIDGVASESCWTKADWAPIDQLWIGAAFSAADFSGKYKAVWTPQKLYILVEVTDDVLFDYYPDPLTNWWDDDCVELFLDENHSGGDHQYNYNAFAYHVSTLYDAVDIGIDQNPHLYNDHIQCKRIKNGSTYTWELAITLYTDAFVYGALNNSVATLSEGKTLGFSIAYCDNDGGIHRDNFIGSQVLADADKNNSYINASLFGTIKLLDPLVVSNGLYANYEDVDLAFTGFSGENFLKIANPVKGGINLSTNVGQVVKDAGSQVWAGITSSQLNSKIDFSQNNLFTLKVYMPKNCTVIFKLEDAANSSINKELSLVSTKVNEWELLTFDFTGAAANTYNKITLFFDYGNTGAGTFYFDEIEQTHDSVTQLDEIASDNTTITFYPNPAMDNLHIEGLKEGGVIKIFDLAGLQLKELKGASVIDINDLSPGIYYLKTQTVVLKFIKL
jgi:hypothetical protein